MKTESVRLIKYTWAHIRGVWLKMGKKDETINEVSSEKIAEKEKTPVELKQERIKKEVRRLKRVFSKLDKNKKSLVETAIQDVAFLAVSMEDLRNKILVEGTTTEYKNGENQYGTKQSPDAQLYMAMSQKHTQAMKILMDALAKQPAQTVVKEVDNFDDFVQGRDSK